MVRFLRIALATILLAFSACASFADESKPLTGANPLIGKWVLTGQGGGLITEFTPTTMSFTPVDERGRPNAPSKVADVTYEQLSDSYAIKLKSGASFMAVFEGKDAVTLSVPGMPATGHYTRMKP